MQTLARLFAALLLLATPLLAAPAPAPAAPPAQSAVSAAAPQLGSAQTKALDALRQAKDALKSAEDAMLAAPDDADAKSAYDDALTAFETQLDAARDLREEAGGRSSEYGQALFEISGKGEDGSAQAALGLVQKWTQQGKDWAVEEGPGAIIKLVLFLVILIVFRLLANIGGGITRKALSTNRVKATDLLKRFFVGIVQKVIFFTGLIIALDQIGIPVAPLLAGVGVVGFIVGFALQDTLSNFAAGIMILLYRPYDIGNYINAAGEAGSVKEMSLVSTTITTPDNQVLIIPNSSIWGGVIRNVTHQETRRVDLTIGVSYSADLDQTTQVLTDVVNAHEKVLKDPAPVIRVVSLGDNSVNFVVRPWCKTADYWDVHFDLHKQIKEALDRADIGIPFPQRDLHLVSVPEGVKLG